MNHFRKPELHFAFFLIIFILTLWPFISEGLLPTKSSFFFYYVILWLVTIFILWLIGRSLQRSESKSEDPSKESQNV